MYSINFTYPVAVTLFSFFLVLFISHLQPATTQETTNARFPFSGPNWYNVFIEPYRELEKAPVLVASNNGLETKNEQPKEVVSEPKETEKTEAETSVSQPPPSAVPSISLDQFNKWMDNLISQVPSFLSIAPWELFRALGIALHFFKEESDSYKELSNLLGLKKTDIPLEKLALISNQIQGNEGDYSSEFFHGDSLPPSNGDLNSILQPAAVTLSGTGICDGRVQCPLTQTYNVLWEYRILFDTQFNFFRHTESLPFYELDGKKNDLFYVEGKGKLKYFGSRENLAMQIDVTVSNPMFRGHFDSSNKDYNAYYIQTKKKLTSSVFHKVKDELMSKPEKDIKVLIPAIFVNSELTFGEKTFPKLFRDKNTDSELLGNINGGALIHSSSMCSNPRFATIYATIDLVFDSERFAGEEAQPPPIQSTLDTLSWFGGYEIRFDKPFYFVVYSHKTNTILHMSYMSGSAAGFNTCTYRT